MFVPKAEQLRGLTLEAAERYGKPHIGAYYAGSHVADSRLKRGVKCAWCGRPATNAHHTPPRRHGTFELITPNGTHLLRPSLIALCGSGTTGCHNGCHGGGWLSITWEWKSSDYARMWWNGEILQNIQPHSPTLYNYGYWQLFDNRRGRVRWIVG